jgi:phospholipid transport system substrate-binding protein
MEGSAMIRKCLNWLLPILLLASGPAPAAEGAPGALVKNVTKEVLTILRNDKDIQAGNRQRAVALIETKVAPHFDFARMTSLAVGRPWQQASAEQRKALIGEFRALLVRTYANSLTAYRNQTVTFKPAPARAAGEEVTVRSEINNPGGRPVSLDYTLARSDAGWKVFDVTIADVSLVTNYRSAFAAEVGSGGVDGLIKSLQEKNRRS